MQQVNTVTPPQSGWALLVEFVRIHGFGCLISTRAQQNLDKLGLAALRSRMKGAWQVNLGEFKRKAEPTMSKYIRRWHSGR